MDFSQKFSYCHRILIPLFNNLEVGNYKGGTIWYSEGYRSGVLRCSNRCLKQLLVHNTPFLTLYFTTRCKTSGVLLEISFVLVKGSFLQYFVQSESVPVQNREESLKEGLL